MYDLPGIIHLLSDDEKAELLRVARGLASIDWRERWAIYVYLLRLDLLSLQQYLDIVCTHDGIG